MKTKMKQLISLVTMLVIMVCSVVPSSVDAVTISRSYTKYVPATGAISTYTLSLSSSDVNARAVIGDTDDRVNQTRNENTGIVRTTATGIDPDDMVAKTFAGTGFIVGDHVIATCAHCFYNEFGFFTNPKITLYNADGTKTTTTYNVVEVHIPTTYKTNMDVVNYLSTYDYALLTVEEDLSGNAHFSVCNMYDESPDALMDDSLYVTGVPGSLNTHVDPPTSNSGNRIYTDAGRLLETSTSSILRYSIDTSGGNSGSPVYMIEQYAVGSTTYYEYAVVGVHVAAYTEATDNDDYYNYGPRMNMYHLQFYGSNDNALY